MSAKGPLAGKRVVVTRAAEEAGELEEMLRGHGAIPLRFPCIAFEDGPDLARIQQRLGEGPDLVVVSSPHAARRLRDLIGQRPIRFAAVGAATAALLPGEVIVPSRGAGAEALVAELGPRVAGKRVLVPRAERGTPALVEGLRRAGAEVEEFTLYRTVTPVGADASVLRGAEAISFASGSAVRGFAQLAGVEAANRCAVAAIGASTAAAAKELGIRIDAYGGEGLAGLCDAIALAVSAARG